MTTDNIYRTDKKGIKNDVEGDIELGPDGSTDEFALLAAQEEGHDIKFRTLTWQKATLLLFAEYVCLAILALPWSFSVLGWATGLIVQIGMGLLTWYTSYILWKYMMKHPHARDVAEIACELVPSWARRGVYEATMAMLIINNIMIIGFHVFTGAKILNTLSDHSTCTVAFQGVAAIIGVVVSIPRTLNHVTSMGVFSAFCMGIAILLCLIFSGIQPHPGKGYGGTYPSLGEVYTTAGLPGNPGFVNGFNAVLNITFLWIEQILYPSFIAEMKEPRDFPKALAALTVLEMVLFLVVSVVGYHYLGQYAEAPLVGSLLEVKHRKAAFAFVIVPTVIIGAIYSNVTVKVLHRRILGSKSRHMHANTTVGWLWWVIITAVVWAIGFVLGNVIPSMGDFLSIMSAAFDSFFGFIFWSAAYFHLYRGRLFSGVFPTLMTLLNIFIFLIGLFMLGPGMYTSVDAIKTDYSGAVKSPFACDDNGL
ncbi:hypothetical protein CspHIS471_0605990 [Cutaneotrichosporon sp. HIS471]|nr:hypothetical protein CspHIS471_0605990 [Cutaneotrichosporon sp. HIS471]